MFSKSLPSRPSWNEDHQDDNHFGDSNTDYDENVDGVNDNDDFSPPSWSP